MAKYNRPDFSMFLAHFTRDGEFCNQQQDENVAAYRRMTAKEKLLSMLAQQKIYASNMPFTHTKGVCFTECPWNSLIAHSHRYSSYGIGFKKQLVFTQDGSPVLYLRTNLFKRLKELSVRKGVVDDIWSFVTPFNPSYGTKYIKDLSRKLHINNPLDFSHEREWRCPADFTFSLDDIAFVVLKELPDVNDIPQDIRTLIKDKIIIMDNYQQIEKLWPMHMLEVSP